MLFSDIINSEEAEDVAKVGNLKIEKIDEDTVIVSDLKSGDQAKVKLSEEDLEVEELGKKDFSEEGEEKECQLNQLQPVHVVGVDTGNHILIDSPVIGEEAAEDLSARLTEAGVDGVQILTDETEARDYISELLDNLGVESQDDIEETQEATFSDVEGNEFGVYVTRYYSSNTVFMDRLFSEASHDIEVSQAKIEDAIENGDEIETESEIVTPISSNEAVIEDKDNDEFTKVTLNDDNMDIKPISKEEAEDLMEDIAVSEEEVDEDEEDEKDFSDIYCNEAETKFFSEHEEMTKYMIRLFSDEENEEKIEEAIESGDKVETDTVVITPVDSETAIIEDKDNGEFTKAIMSEEDIDVTPISEEEADSLTEKKEEEKADAEEEKAEENEAKAEEAEEKAEEAEEKAEDAAEDAADGEEEKKEEKEESKGFSNTILDKWFAEVVTPVSRPVAPAAPAQAPVPVAVVPAAEAEAPAEAPAAEETPSIEAIEDKAIAAVQQIQAAAAEAEAQILNAKAAPAEEAEADLQEAQFSEKEKTFSKNDTLVSWLNVNTKH